MTATNSQLINLPQILEQIGGDRDLLREVIGVFLLDSPDIRSRLQAALGTTPAALREVAHCAKSAVGNFCAAKAVAAAVALEEACKNGQTSGLDNLTASLTAALIEVEDALRAGLDSEF